jgi:hypothetical protein
MSEKTFVDGFIAKFPHEKSQDFVVANISFKAQELIAFIEKHKKPDGYVNVDLLKSKDGQKMCAVLNEWKREEKKAGAPVLPEYLSVPPEGYETIKPEDVPW